MKKIQCFFNLVLLICAAFLFSCQKEIKLTVPTLPTLPTVTTDSATSVLSGSAIIYNKVTGDGNGAVTARGVCWKISSNPTINDNKTINGTGTGIFTSSITGLTPNTIYYVKAYVTNSAGTTYGAEISFTTEVASVIISTQKWMLNNLDVPMYRNGDLIPQVSDSVQWANLTTGAWCYYKNDQANEAGYGKLYNWYAVNDARGLAPLGWHVPTKEEWVTLTAFLGGDAAAGGKLKATTMWTSPNTGATNETGFTALPGGLRGGDAKFLNIGGYGYWWTSKEHDAVNAVERGLQFDVSDSYMYWLSKSCGISVRCIKD